MPDPAQILREAYEQVRRDYGAAIGQRRAELVTPALVLDVDAVQRNIDHMASELKQMGAAVIRPHYKGHKNPDIARRLVISRRTAEHHVQDVYAHIGVSSRAGAALFAMEHDLLSKKDW